MNYYDDYEPIFLDNKLAGHKIKPDIPTLYCLFKTIERCYPNALDYRLVKCPSEQDKRVYTVEIRDDIQEIRF